MKRFARTTALLAVSAFALAACSGGGDEDPLAGDTADGGAIVVDSAFASFACRARLTK